MPDNMPNDRVHELANGGIGASSAEIQSLAAEALRYRKFAADQQRAHNAELEKSVEDALGLAMSYGGTDGDHHKTWVIDQMVRALTGCPIVTRNSRFLNAQGEHYDYEGYGESTEYVAFVADAKNGEDGPDTYEWDEGIAP